MHSFIYITNNAHFPESVANGQERNEVDLHQHHNGEEQTELGLVLRGEREYENVREDRRRRRPDDRHCHTARILSLQSQGTKERREHA